MARLRLQMTVVPSLLVTKPDNPAAPFYFIVAAKGASL